MYCNKCGEKNPEEAVYCRNCGAELRQEVKKTEIIESIPNQNYDQQPPKSENKGNDDWKCCCGCLVLIFVIFAIATLIH